MVVLVSNIQEEGFGPEKIQDYNLSLLIGPDRLSYLVSDSRKEVLCLVAYAFEGQKGMPISLRDEIEDLLLKDSLLCNAYAQIDIFLYTKRFTIIPEQLYDEEQKELYLSTAMHIDSSDVLQVNQLSAIQAKLIYSINKDLHQLLTGVFPNAYQHCAATSLINTLVPTLSKEDYTFYVLLQARSICLTIVYKNKLLLHQIYGYQNAEDCLYYVLLAFKSLGLSPEKQSIKLAGELIQDSEIYKLLFQYVRYIEFVERPSLLTYGSNIQRLPSQFYFDLFHAAASNYTSDK